MRWLWALVMVWCVGCVGPLSLDAGWAADDAGSEAHDAGSAADAGPAPEPYDPCVWDGHGDDLCFADTAVVFDGTECRHVCGAQARPGVPGVFPTEADCRKTCPCNPEKFVLWPGPGPAGPIAVRGLCDQVEAVTDAGASVPWPTEDCRSRSLWTFGGDQTCATGIVGGDHGWLDRRSLVNICRVSTLPQVKQVVCVVWVD